MKTKHWRDFINSLAKFSPSEVKILISYDILVAAEGSLSISLSLHKYPLRCLLLSVCIYAKKFYCRWLVGRPVASLVQSLLYSVSAGPELLFYYISGVAIFWIWSMNPDGVTLPRMSGLNVLTVILELLCGTMVCSLSLPPYLPLSFSLCLCVCVLKITKPLDITVYTSSYVIACVSGSNPCYFVTDI